jgi:hypothetical protein
VEIETPRSGQNGRQRVRFQRCLKHLCPARRGAAAHFATRLLCAAQPHPLGSHATHAHLAGARPLSYRVRGPRRDLFHGSFSRRCRYFLVCVAPVAASFCFCSVRFFSRSAPAVSPVLESRSVTLTGVPCSPKRERRLLLREHWLERRRGGETPQGLWAEWRRKSACLSAARALAAVGGAGHARKFR